MALKAVLFDLDGTLLNTLGDLTDSVNQTLEKMSLPLRSEAEVRDFTGNGLHALIKRSLGAYNSPELLDAAMGIFRIRYGENMEKKTAPYPGIIDMLREVKGMGLRTATVSNKYDAAVKRVADKYFGDLLDAAMGEGAGTPPKPDPTGCMAALSKLGSTPGEALYVGDSDVDLYTARNAGMEFIGVSWGFRRRETLVSAGAVTIAGRAEELTEIIRSAVKQQ